MSTWLISELALLAQKGVVEGDEPRNYAISWAIIMLSVVLGMMVALRPAKMEDKVKKPVQD